MSVKHYSKKPVVIEALQWTGKNVVELIKFCPVCYMKDDVLQISTLEGVMSASEGDMIIKGVKGEFYPCKHDIFLMTYDDQTVNAVGPGKSLHNTTANGAKKNVKDIKFWGDGDTFRLISKASSEAEGWMKSTKAMPAGSSVVVQVTTQQRNPDGTYAVAEALTTIPNVIIAEFVDNGVVTSRTLVERNMKDHTGLSIIRHENVPVEFAENGSK
jgi:hypothetical protein